MSKSQRTKGRTGERALRLLLQERDYQVFPRPRGEAGDDFTVIDTQGTAWSVECKNTRSLNHSMWAQCKRNAGKRNRMLGWHPSGWDFPGDYWLIFFWPKGERAYVRAWRANGDFDEVEGVGYEDE